MIQTILQHREFLTDSRLIDWKVKERARAELNSLLRERLMQSFELEQSDGSLDAAIDRIAARTLAPWDAVAELIR